MYKRLTICLSLVLILTFSVFADQEKIEEEEKNMFIERQDSAIPVEFHIVSSTNVVAKRQNSYRTPLDSNDRFLRDIKDNGEDDSASSIEDEKTWGSSSRKGANNRENQNYRLRSELTMMGLMGRQKTDNLVWYNYATVVQFLVDPNDPDDINATDDESTVTLKTGDIWFRYSPFLPLGITVGTQTVQQTAPAVTIDHTYKGDLDNDFVLYTGSLLTSAPGISIDTYWSSDFNLGFGHYDSMSIFSELATSGAKDEAATDAAWIALNTDLFRFSLSYQSVAVGGTKDQDDPDVQDVWQRKYKHKLINSALRVNIGWFSPYLIYQEISGKKVDISVEPPDIEEIVQWYQSLGIPSATGLIAKTAEDRDMKASLSSVGFIADLGKYGELAVDYTAVDSPGYGKKNWIPLFTEGGHETLLNYTYNVSENLSLTLFYNNKQAVKDKDLEDDIDMLNNTIAEMETADPNEQYLRDLQQYVTVLESYRLSSTTSVGISIQMTFTN